MPDDSVSDFHILRKEDISKSLAETRDDIIKGVYDPLFKSFGVFPKTTENVVGKSANFIGKFSTHVGTCEGADIDIQDHLNG